MPKITAIESGGDWNDASVDYLCLPNGMNIEDEHRYYKFWLTNVYQVMTPIVKYQTFTEWLMSKGATEPEEAELDIFYED